METEALRLSQGQGSIETEASQQARQRPPGASAEMMKEICLDEPTESYSTTMSLDSRW